MAEKKLIVVIGATGLQGGSVVNTFLGDSSWKVRAITRSASSSKARALEGKGAEVFEANLNDVSSLHKAFEGASAVFGVTDFWTLYGDSSFRSQLKPGQAMNELCFDLELQQGKNIFDAAAKVPTLKRLVYSTLPHVNKLSNGKYTKVFHFDAKAVAAEYAEKTYPELWSKTSMIQLGFYLTNYSQQPWLMPTKNEETGTYDINDFGDTGLSPYVAAEKDTGVLTKALVAAPAGKNLAAFREQIKASDFIELLGKTLDVKTRVTSGSLEGMPSELDQEMAETFAWAQEFGFYGEKVDSSIIYPKQLDPSLQLGTAEEWIKEQDWSQIFKA